MSQGILGNLCAPYGVADRGANKLNILDPARVNSQQRGVGEGKGCFGGKKDTWCRAPSHLINLSRRASSRCSAALREERKRLPSWSRWGERAPTLERVALRVAIADFGMDLPR